MYDDYAIRGRDLNTVRFNQRVKRRAFRYLVRRKDGVEPFVVEVMVTDLMPGVPQSLGRSLGYRVVEAPIRRMRKDD
jgi:hypothetical protein